MPDKNFKDNEIKLLKHIISLVTRYISKKWLEVDAKEVLVALEAIVTREKVVDTIVNSPDIGTTLFGRLGRYIPIRISRLDTAVENIKLKADLPSLFAKLLYAVYTDGLLRLTDIIRIPTISKRKILGGVKKLLAMRLGGDSRLLAERSMDREIMSTIKFKRILSSIGEGMDIPSFISCLENYDDPDKGIDLMELSKRELNRKILALFHAYYQSSSRSDKA